MPEVYYDQPNEIEEVETRRERMNAFYSETRFIAISILFETRNIRSILENGRITIEDLHAFNKNRQVEMQADRYREKLIYEARVEKLCKQIDFAKDKDQNITLRIKELNDQILELKLIIYKKLFNVKMKSAESMLIELEMNEYDNSKEEAACILNWLPEDEYQQMDVQEKLKWVFGKKGAKNILDQVYKKKNLVKQLDTQLVLQSLKKIVPLIVFCRKLYHQQTSIHEQIIIFEKQLSDNQQAYNMMGVFKKDFEKLEQMKDIINQYAHSNNKFSEEMREENQFFEDHLKDVLVRFN